MEEAEALSTKIAIQVEGNLRCIGSIQQIKNKFGRGYEIEVKLKKITKEVIMEVIEQKLQNFNKRIHMNQIESVLTIMNA